MTASVTGMSILAPSVTVGASAGADIAVAQRAGDTFTGSPLGSIVPTSDGDVATCSGSQALLARCIRLVSTAANAYVHLGDWGGRPKLGSLATRAELDASVLRIMRALMGDPDVTEAVVRVTLAPNGIRRAALYDVEVRDRAGNTHKFQTPGGT